MKLTKGNRFSGKRVKALAVLAGAATALSLAVAMPSAAAPAPMNSNSHASVGDAIADFGCANAKPRQMHCLGKIKAHHNSDGKLAPMTTTSPVGYGAPDIQSAYKLKGKTSGGKTVAIVDAQDDPTAEADLQVYRKQYGLPACTTANGCFKKVNQDGKTSPLPSADAGWAEEISLDLDMVSATCPDCKILLVEASSPNTDPLGVAENTAVRLGASAVSNSWGGNEDSTIAAADSKYFKHDGVAITASSGDSGYGVIWPASSPYTTAVGGTSLNKSSNARGWSETAWSGAGSGCSASEPKPSWQTDKGCAKKTVADVSAVADPNTGLAVYDTYNTCGHSSLCDLLIQLGLVQGADGWVQVGGTSASSPIIASVYALAGNSVHYGSYPYSHKANLNDVTSGSNGSCGGSYLCTAGSGYDGPTGLGTPNGTGAF